MKAFNLARIMKEAHRQARFYARPGEYRQTLAWTLKAAWRMEREIIAAQRLEAERAATEQPEAAAVRIAILKIETQDRMTVADFAQVASLRSEFGRLHAA